MKRILLTLSSTLILTACGGSGGGQTASLVPATPGNGNVPVSNPQQNLTVFSNYGEIANRMSLNFAGLSSGNAVMRFYYQYQDGSIHDSVSLDSSNYEVRRCRDTIEIDGTDAEGTITITGAIEIWANDTSEYAHDTWCAVNNGTYHYFVDGSGLWMGPQGSETLYQLQ